VATSRTPGPLGFEEVHVDPERETPAYAPEQPSPLFYMRRSSSEDIATPPSSHALPQRPRLSPRAETFPVLRVGSRGAAVGRLQRLLNQRHAATSSGRAALVVDQIFGPLTRQSVELFQRYAEIESDGIVGPITWAHLLSDRLLPSSAGSRASGSRPATTARPPAGAPKAAAHSVADWPLEKKFEEVLRRTTPKLPFAMQQEFAQLLTPQAIAMTAAILAALAVAHLFGVGEVVDIALLLVGVVFLGLSIFDVVSHLADFLVGTARADSSADLDEAAEHLAYAISVIGVAAFLALLRKARTGRGKPKSPQQDGPKPEPPPKPAPKPRPEPEPPKPRPEPEPKPKPRPKQAPPGHTQPTGELGGKPTGGRAKVRPQDDAATRRSSQRENESADLLAERGYRVEQKPSVPTETKPDYKIEGEIFDCKAPETPRPRNAASEIEDSVREGQADRFVLNLEDSTIAPEAMKKQLTDWPIEGLKEVLVIKNGEVIPLWP
jgi:hypothetical protein